MFINGAPLAIVSIYTTYKNYYSLFVIITLCHSKTALLLSNSFSNLSFCIKYKILLSFFVIKTVFLINCIYSHFDRFKCFLTIFWKHKQFYLHLKLISILKTPFIKFIVPVILI